MKKHASLFKSIWDAQQSGEDQTTLEVMHEQYLNSEQIKNQQLLHILAGDLYMHLETHGKETGCCDPQLNIYCPIGQNLKLGYTTAVQMAQEHVH